MSHSQRRTLIDGSLILVRQADLLDIARSSLYYVPRVNERDQKIMNTIDEIYTEYPFYGSRKITWVLRTNYHHQINRKKVQRLMRLMGLEAIYPRRKPNTSLSHPQHRKYPYLLQNLAIIRPNQVWGTDITYIKLETGWAYLVAFIDWFSRYVISWELSHTLEIAFCLTARDRALQVATPEISNSDQGSHFTSEQFLSPLLHNNVRISMDGRGRCMDNIFTERLWRTVKYENVYLKSYRTIAEANAGLTDYFQFYNTERPHQSLEYQTPESVYRH